MAKHPAIRKEFNFEQSMKRLEEIVETIEQGDIPLDKIMKMYEEGVALSKLCLQHLQQTELTLKRLGRDLEGNIKLTEDE
jgi:exodeoxyribonuclease VII small subunit